MTEKSLLSLFDFTRLLIDAIESSGVAYMLGGALAVMAYAEARATQDVDIVLDLPIESAAAFSTRLEERDIHIPPEIILERFETPEFDIPLSGVHRYSGQRADIYLLHQGDQLRSEALGRRRLIDLGAPLNELYVHAPEDLILYKLRYFSISQQDKHVRDITAVVLAQGDKLDAGYLENWVSRMGLDYLWRRMMEEIEKLRGT